MTDPISGALPPSPLLLIPSPTLTPVEAPSTSSRASSEDLTTLAQKTIDLLKEAEQYKSSASAIVKGKKGKKRKSSEGSEEYKKAMQVYNETMENCRRICKTPGVKQLLAERAIGLRKEAEKFNSRARTIARGKNGQSSEEYKRAMQVYSENMRNVRELSKIPGVKQSIAKIDQQTRAKKEQQKRAERDAYEIIEPQQRIPIPNPQQDHLLAASKTQEMAIQVMAQQLLLERACIPPPPPLPQPAPQNPIDTYKKTLKKRRLTLSSLMTRAKEGVGPQTYEQLKTQRDLVNQHSRFIRDHEKTIKNQQTQQKWLEFQLASIMTAQEFLDQQTEVLQRQTEAVSPQVSSSVESAMLPSSPFTIPFTPLTPLPLDEPAPTFPEEHFS